MGYQATTVAPVLVDVASFDRKVDRRALDRAAPRRKRGSEWLFVGRLAPNKAQHDVLHAFALYRRCYDPHATLSLVGGSSSLRYERAAARPSMSARPRRQRADAGLGVRLQRSPRTTARPTCSCACRITRGSACRCSRRCTTSCRSSRSRRRRCPRRSVAAGLCLPDKAPAAVAHAVSVVLDRPRVARAARARRARRASATSTSCTRARRSRRPSRAAMGVAA